jgi:uncharacterized membrane protein YhdT
VGSILVSVFAVAIYVVDHYADGLHYVVGLPRWFEYAVRAAVFLLSVIVGAVTLSMVAQWRHSHHDNTLIVLGICLLCVRNAIISLERWKVPLTLEGCPFVLPALLAIGWGLRHRVLSGRFGK